MSAAYSFRTICRTIGPRILLPSSPLRRIIAAWSARTLSASLTDTRKPPPPSSSAAAGASDLLEPTDPNPPAPPARLPGVPGGTPLTLASSSSAAIAASCCVARTGNRRANVVVCASPSAHTAPPGVASSPSLAAASATGTPSRVLPVALLTSSLTSMTTQVQQRAPPAAAAPTATPAPTAAASFSGTQCMNTPAGTTTPAGRSTSCRRHPAPTVARAPTSQCATSDPAPTLAPIATCDASMHAPGPEDRPDPQTPSAPIDLRLAPKPAASIMPLSHVPRCVPACAAGYAARTLASTAVCSSSSGMVPTCTNLLGSIGRMSSGLPATHAATSSLARRSRSPLSVDESIEPDPDPDPDPDAVTLVTLATWSTRRMYAALGSGSLPMGCMKSP